MSNQFVNGDKELIAKLQALKKTHAKAAIRRGSRAGAKIIAAQVKDEAPVKTGNLKASIKVRALPRSKKYTGAQCTLLNDTLYYGSFVELGTKKMKANDFMKRATDASKDAAFDTALTTIKAEIEARMTQ